MWENFVLLAIFDTCDVVYNWSISLLPPIVLDNLFEGTWNFFLSLPHIFEWSESKVLSVILIYMYLTGMYIFSMIPPLSPEKWNLGGGRGMIFSLIVKSALFLAENRNYWKNHKKGLKLASLFFLFRFSPLVVMQCFPQCSVGKGGG